MRTDAPSTRIITLLGAFIITILTAGLSLATGTHVLNLEEIWLALSQPTESTESVIFWEFRLPKTLTGAFGGAGLAIGGLLTQSLFRNPLTGPDILGLSSGAGLFVALLTLSGLPLVGFSLTFAAVTGAAITFLLLLALSRRLQNNALLVAGIMVSALASAVISALQYYSGAEDLQRYTIWSLGSIGRTGLPETTGLAITVLFGASVALSSAKGLDAIGLSDHYAASMGVSVKSLRIKILISTALLTGAITAFCGPISFVGIAAPHLARRFSRSQSHRHLLPISALIGAWLVMVCDLLSQLPGAGQVMPLNALTAITGAPVVLWALWKNRETI